MKIAVLAGGVGGARFLRALRTAVPDEDLTAIVNVGDDLEIAGLYISPDLDTVLYTLAGLADEERGWGRKGETWRALDTLRELGAQSAWFALGDSDLGLHLARTEALNAGEPLSAVTARFAAAAGLQLALLPATDDRLRTVVETPSGRLAFQDWFVRRGHRDPVDAVHFEGAGKARPAPGVLEALTDADVVAIAPSNPYVSVAPILAVPGIREAVEARPGPTLAISPLIGGRTVKGPAADMLERLAGGTSPAHVASCYAGLIDTLVLDPADAADADGLAALGIRPLVAPTLMSGPDAGSPLAAAVADAAAVRV